MATAESERAAGMGKRVGGALIAGCLLGAPTGWLLSYLAALPAFLGLFFFLMAGLLLGATMFRIGKPAAPVARSTLRLVGGAVAVFTCLVALVGEYVDFPGDAVQSVRNSIPRVLTAEQRRRLDEDTRQYVMSHITGSDFRGSLGEHVRGFFSYVAWAATDGKLECPRVFGESTHTFKLGHRRIPWVIREVLSLVLLTFTLLSQFAGLAKVPAPPAAEGQPACSPPGNPGGDGPVVAVIGKTGSARPPGGADGDGTGGRE